MQKLRSIHLYLGCIFAPLLLVFAISGIFQTLGFHPHSQILDALTRIHKNVLNIKHEKLTQIFLDVFAAIMAASFIATTILGVIMAFNYGRSRRAVFYCLVFGVAFPLLLILFGHLV